MALLKKWCWCEGPLCLRPILEDSHFMPACDTSNMASVFRLIYAHEVRTGAKFDPSFAIRGKTCGPMGRRPTFCWGPKVLPWFLPQRENKDVKSARSSADGLTHIRMGYSLPASSEHQCRQWQCGVRFLETLVPNETFPAHRIPFPRSRCMLTSSHAYRSLCPPTTRTASRVGDTPYAN